MSVTATGGFSTKNLSIGAFDSVAIDLITMFFMLLSSIHFGMVYVAIVTRSLKPFKNDVFKFYIWTIIVTSIIVAVSLKANGIEDSWGRSMLASSFHVISYASTSGFGISDNGIWPSLPSALLVFVGIWCGMAGSTTGGIKSDRALLLCKEVHYRLKTVLHPASVSEVRINKRVIRQEDIAPHILYIALYMMLIIISLAINLAVNPGNSNAIAATFTSLSNVGPAIRDLGVFGNFGAEPTGAKLIYTFDMFLGRVEIYPVLAVLMMITGKTAK